MASIQTDDEVSDTETIIFTPGRLPRRPRHLYSDEQLRFLLTARRHFDFSWHEVERLFNFHFVDDVKEHLPWHVLHTFLHSSVTKGNSERTRIVREILSKPLHGTTTDYNIVSNVARRLGMGTQSRRRTFENPQFKRWTRKSRRVAKNRREDDDVDDEEDSSEQSSPELHRWLAERTQTPEGARNSKARKRAMARPQRQQGQTTVKDNSEKQHAPPVILFRATCPTSQGKDSFQHPEIIHRGAAFIAGRFVDETQSSDPLTTRISQLTEREKHSNLEEHLQRTKIPGGSAWISFTNSFIRAVTVALDFAAQGHRTQIAVLDVSKMGAIVHANTMCLTLRNAKSPISRTYWYRGWFEYLQFGFTPYEALVNNFDIEDLVNAVSGTPWEDIRELYKERRQKIRPPKRLNIDQAMPFAERICDVIFGGPADRQDSRLFQHAVQNVLQSFNVTDNLEEYSPPRYIKTPGRMQTLARVLITPNSSDPSSSSSSLSLSSSAAAASLSRAQNIHGGRFKSLGKVDSIPFRLNLNVRRSELVPRGGRQTDRSLESSSQSSLPSVEYFPRNLGPRPRLHLIQSPYAQNDSQDRSGCSSGSLSPLLTPSPSPSPPPPPSLPPPTLPPLEFWQQDTGGWLTNEYNNGQPTNNKKDMLPDVMIFQQGVGWSNVLKNT